MPARFKPNNEAKIAIEVNSEAEVDNEVEMDNESEICWPYVGRKKFETLVEKLK